MSELVCVTSGCREGGVGIETRGARRIAFCAKSCDLCTGASASTSPRSSRAEAAAAAATSQLRESSAPEKLRLPVGLLGLPRELWIENFGGLWAREMSG